MRAFLGLCMAIAGQENYDALGAAVTAWTKASLATIGGLCPVTVDKKATAYVSPAGVGAGVDPATPRLLLVHGSMPGGSCGIWGRSLCINVSTLGGAMFDYIRGAHERAYSTAFLFSLSFAVWWLLAADGACCLLARARVAVSIVPFSTASARQPVPLLALPPPLRL